jgi:hypothetical protein
MNFTKVIGLLALIFVFIIACAGTSEKSETEQLSKQTETSHLNEPWTGIWKVEGSWQAANDGLWVLKQSGNSVVSTKDSQSKVKGKVEGDQLKGKVEYQRWTHRIAVKISPDGQSFKGIYDWGTRPTELKGIKQ